MHKPKHLLAAVAVAATFVAFPARAFADEPRAEASEEGAPIHRAAFFAGTSVLLLSYAPSAIVAGTSDRREDRHLFYPVAGPWLDLANRNCKARPCEDEGADKALLVTDGILQGVGALWMLTSLVIPEPPSKKSPVAAEIGPVKLSPARVGRTGYGLSAIGTF